MRSHVLWVRNFARKRANCVKNGPSHKFSVDVILKLYVVCAKKYMFVLYDVHQKIDE